MRRRLGPSIAAQSKRSGDRPIMSLPRVPHAAPRRNPAGRAV